MPSKQHLYPSRPPTATNTSDASGAQAPLRLSFVILASCRIVLAVTILAALLLVLGAFVPSVPFFGSRGSSVITLYPRALVLVPLFACGMLVAGDARAIWPNQLSKLLVIGGLTASLFAAIGMGRMIAVGQENGASVNLLGPLWPAATMHSAPSSQRISVTDYAGENVPIAIYPPAVETGDAPVFLYIHGGGFVGGNHLMRGDDLRWFAEHGFLVFSVGYGLSSASDHRWDRALGQIGCALNWIKANAADMGGNGQRVAIMGDSAGGNLALNAAYRAGLGTLPTSCNGELPQVAAVGALYPVVSVADWHNNPHPRFAADSQRMAQAYMGGTPQQFPARYAQVDPVTHLTATAAPTLLLHGTNDSTVQIAAAHYLRARAREVGAPLRLITLPHAEHAFDRRATIGNQIMRQTMRDFFRAELAP